MVIEKHGFATIMKECAHLDHNCGTEPGLKKSRFGDLGSGSKSMEVVIAARIFDPSSKTLYYRPRNGYRET